MFRGKTLKIIWNENKICQNRGRWILYLHSSIDSECGGLDLTAFISWRSANKPLEDYNRNTQTVHISLNCEKETQKQIKGRTDAKCARGWWRMRGICKWSEISLVVVERLCWGRDSRWTIVKHDSNNALVHFEINVY